MPSRGIATVKDQQYIMPQQTLNTMASGAIDQANKDITRAAPTIAPQNFAQAQQATAQQATAQQAGTTKVAPTATYGGAKIDQSQQGQFRAAQSGLVGQLQQAAAGQGPSLVPGVLQAGTQQGLQAALAAAASQRGGSAALAQRNIQNNQAQQQAATAGQAAQMKIQEQQAARQQLAGAAGEARAADIGLASTQAGLTQQAGLTNAAATNQTNQIQAQLNQQTQLQNAQLGTQTAIQNAQLGTQTSLANAQLGTGTSQFNAGQGNQINLDQAKLQLEQGQINDQQYAQLQQLAANEVGAAGGFGTAMSQADIARDALRAGIAQNQTGQMLGIAGQVAGAGAGIATAVLSDPKEKKDIKEVDEDDINNGLTVSSPISEKTGIQGASDLDINSFLDQFHRQTAGSQVQSPDLTSSFSALGGAIKNKLADKTVHAPTDGSLSEGTSKAIDTAMTSFDTAHPGGSYEENKADDLSMLTGSDPKMKTGIKGFKTGELTNFLDNIKGYEYSYKNPDHLGAASGRHVSPMADDLAKTRLGKQMVKRGPDGKLLVDYGRGFGTMLAAQSSLHDRVSELEKALKISVKKNKVIE
jgi:hypothetical protein